MDWIGHLALILLIKIVCPATIPTASVTTVTPATVTQKTVTPASVTPTTLTPTTVTSKNEELKTNKTYQMTENTKDYQVTENIKDIPDNRPLPPIIPNFGLVIPLNFGNNSLVNNVIDNKIEENATEYNTNKENEGNVKKNSFSIFHIKAEYDEKPAEPHQNVFSKVFGGFKDYVYSLKRGVVDGLHSYFHHHDADEKPVKEIKPVKETSFFFPNRYQDFHKYDKFHRSFGDEDFDEEHDEDDYLNEHFSH